jgi:hypothetical protein
MARHALLTPGRIFCKNRRRVRANSIGAQKVVPFELRRLAAALEVRRCAPRHSLGASSRKGWPKQRLPHSTEEAHADPRVLVGGHKDSARW